MERRIPLLALATFAAGTQSFAFAGLLAEMAADLDVTVAEAGQLATVFALVSGLSAPPVAIALRRVSRKHLVVGALWMMAVVNLLLAAAPSLTAMLGLRALAGLGAASLPATSALAAAMAPPERRGRALALVVTGVTAAFLLGVPLGSAAGGLFGWRACFVFAAAMLALAALGIGFGIPNVAAGDLAGAPSIGLLARPGVARGLATTFLGFTAVFCFAAYIGPAVNQVSRLSGGAVGAMQMVVGLGSILGAPAGGRLADRGFGRPALLGLFALVAVGQGLQAVLLAAPPDGWAAVLAQGMLILLVSASLFAVSPIIQTRLIGLAPDARSTVLSFNAATFFLGQAAGAGLGGLAIALGGLPAIGLAGATAALAGLVVIAWPEPAHSVQS
jgi:predicted MFS family arabinose efflux permease